MQTHRAKKIVDTLVQKGFLLRQETVKEKTHGQTGIKMLRMAAPPDEVPPVTKTQQKLVRILQETGAVSEKEACYLSGVTTAVAKNAGAERRGGILYGEAAAAHICRQRSDPPARRYRAVRGTAGSI